MPVIKYIKIFCRLLAPGEGNLGDYPSKHHKGAHHRLVHPIYLHEINSPLVLERALTPQEVRALGVDLVSPWAGG